MAIAHRSPAAAVNAAPRAAARQRVAVPARLTWKDASGAVRFASVTTRDLSDGGAFVECAAQAPIPLFRLVHLQLEVASPLAPAHLNGTRTLAAVWRVESPKPARRAVRLRPALPGRAGDGRGVGADTALRRAGDGVRQLSQRGSALTPASRFRQ